MHPTPVRIEPRPEATHVPIVARSVRFRVVPEQGIRDKIGRLKRPGGAGIGEQRHINKVPQLTERTAGDTPLICPLLQRAFDAAAIMDDQSSLLPARRLTAAWYRIAIQRREVRTRCGRGQEDGVC